MTKVNNIIWTQSTVDIQKQEYANSAKLCPIDVYIVSSLGLQDTWFVGL